MAYIIYLALCGLQGLTCARADIEVKDWKYWVLLGYVIGAYFVVNTPKTVIEFCF